MKLHLEWMARGLNLPSQEGWVMNRDLDNETLVESVLTAVQAATEGYVLFDLPDIRRRVEAIEDDFLRQGLGAVLDQLDAGKVGNARALLPRVLKRAVSR